MYSTAVAALTIAAVAAPAMAGLVPLNARSSAMAAREPSFRVSAVPAVTVTRRELRARELRARQAAVNEFQSGAFKGADIDFGKIASLAGSFIKSFFSGGKRELTDRDLVDLESYTRDLVARGEIDESGASLLSSIVSALPTVFSGISAISGLFKNDANKREYEEHVMREIIARAATDESGAFLGALLRFAPTIISGISSLFSGNKREFDDNLVRELIARAELDESGAFAFKDILNLFFPPRVVRRAATDSADLQSGAFKGADIDFGKIASLAGSFIKSFFSGGKRELTERDLVDLESYTRDLVARGEIDESGASLISSFVSAIPTIFSGISAISGLFKDKNQKREFEEHVMREIVARAENDESGAFLGALLRFAPTIISGISSLFSGNKREFEELMARAETDESGAFLGALLRFAPTIISGITSLFGGNKREFDELLARAENDESGAFLGAFLRFIPSIISGVSSIFGGNKRELEEQFVRELVARATLDDQSGAFKGADIDFGRLASLAGTFIKGFFGGKREDIIGELLARSLVQEAARSLNELD